MEAGSTSSSLRQGACRSIAKWSWNRGYGKPMITVFLPGAIDHMRDEFGLLDPPFMGCKFSAWHKKRFIYPSRLQFAIVDYINNIYVTTNDVTKGLIGPCQTRTVQRFWA